MAEYKGQTRTTFTEALRLAELAAKSQSTPEVPCADAVARKVKRSKSKD